MTRLHPLTGATFLLLVALTFLACGSNRKLESVTLSPTSADAKNFPNGQVPFTATGMYSKPPSPVPLTSKDVFWCVGSNGACDGNVNTGASLTQDGVAQCNQNFVGTVTVLAGTSMPPMNPDKGPNLIIFGSAQLTCP
jgi:hypothetical protein